MIVPPAYALIAAVGDVVVRHEILRTTYIDAEGVPYQMVNPVTELAVRRDTGDGDPWLQEQLEAERRHCFELDREWPIRVAVLHTGDTGEHVLSLVVHHIASDHWSAGVLFSDVITAYRARRDGEAPSWAPLRVQYADYAAWQRTFLGEPGGQQTAVAAEPGYVRAKAQRTHVPARVSSPGGAPNSNPPNWPPALST